MKEKEKSWFLTGEEGLKAKQSIRNENYVSRFFLRPKEEAKIVFVDDGGFFCWVHQLQINGSWNNWATCTRDFAPCKICEKIPTDPQRYSRRYGEYFTIIDTREITLRNGDKINNRKCLLRATGPAIDRLADLKSKHGSLSGLVFTVKRYTSTESACGSSFDYEGKTDIGKKFGEEFTKPIDYATVLAPPTQEELNRLGLNSGIIVGSSEDIGKDKEDIDLF